MAIRAHIPKPPVCSPYPECLAFIELLRIYLNMLRAKVISIAGEAPAKTEIFQTAYPK